MGDDAARTTGQYLFEVVIADWDLAGTDGIGTVNNGIKFNFGSAANGSAQLESDEYRFGYGSTPCRPRHGVVVYPGRCWQRRKFCGSGYRRSGNDLDRSYSARG